jgi:hypothetical protein
MAERLRIQLYVVCLFGILKQPLQLIVNNVLDLAIADHDSLARHKKVFLNSIAINGSAVGAAQIDNCGAVR